MVEGITERNIFHAESMEKAVRLAYVHGKKTVLLSNASPSFNLFKDYKDKSAQYRKWIAELGG